MLSVAWLLVDVLRGAAPFGGPIIPGIAPPSPAQSRPFRLVMGARLTNAAPGLVPLLRELGIAVVLLTWPTAAKECMAHDVCPWGYNGVIRRCAGCPVTSSRLPPGTDKLRKCGSCRRALYCSRACQKRDFQTHKPMCEVLRLGWDAACIAAELKGEPIEPHVDLSR